MAKKTYRAYGSIVTLKMPINGIDVDIKFTPVSNYEAGGRGSKYVTDNEYIQYALENCGYFGSTYVLESTEAQIKYVEKKEEEVKKDLKTISVSGLEDAKAYLKDHFDWKPTSRPTKASVEKVAEAFGIKFEYN